MSGRWFLLMSFLISLCTSLFVLSSVPAFQAYGDVSIYSSLGREIAMNGFLIPQTNTLHYPGSVWIYPPVIPYMFAAIVSLTGPGTTEYFVFAFLGSILFSLTCIPFYYVGRILFTEQTGRFASLLYAVFPPSLYIIGWGGFPQLLGFFIVVWILYIALKVQDQEFHFLKYTILEGILLGILSLSHDLSSFIVMLTFVSLSFYFVCRRLVLGRSSTVTRNIAFSVGSLAIGSVSVIAWYLPRIWWVIDAALPGSSPVYRSYATSSGHTISVLGAIYDDVFSQSPPVFGISINLGLLVIMLVIFPIALAYLWRLKNSGDKNAIMALFLLVPALIMLFEFRDSVLFSRVSYFVALFAFPLFSRLAYVVIFTRRNPGLYRGDRPTGTINSALTVAVVVLVAANSALALGLGYSLHTYNSPDGSQNDGYLQVANFFLDNAMTRGKTVAAPGDLGFFISGYAGNPALVYENYTLLTQPVEWNESHAAYVLIFQSSNSQSNVSSYVRDYGVSYVVIPSTVTVYYSGYSLVFKDSNYCVYDA
ncbi:MAG: hypothetical protein M1151_06675 [Candidatus Thermoplasmatota archaeon]|nr:hypothetical protein [Candidatus Thermoplasmatota archaeon]